MKYCLSSRQKHEYLVKADEIRVEYRDRDIIYDFSQKYPEATFILVMPFNPEIAIDWNEIEKYKTVSQNKLILCLNAISRDAQECRARDLKFYWGFPVGTFYELQALKKLGVCYAKLAAPAFFKMEAVKKIGVPVRATPNVAHQGYLPLGDGVCGTWIRPEDLDLYEEYVETIEFEDADLKKEQALYRIYHDEKAWPGEMSMLISNFTQPGLNRLISPGDLTSRRLNCGQRCQEGGACRLCHRTIALAQPELIKKVADAIHQQTLQSAT